MYEMINLKRVVSSKAFTQRVQFESVVSEIGTDGLAHDVKTSFTANAIVRPAGKDDLELLPEGQRFFPTMLIHIARPLTVGDHMHYHGQRWKVVNAQDWKDYGFFRCVAIKYDGTETSDSEGFTVT